MLFQTLSPIIGHTMKLKISSTQHEVESSFFVMLPKHLSLVESLDKCYTLFVVWNRYILFGIFQNILGCNAAIPTLHTINSYSRKFIFCTWSLHRSPTLSPAWLLDSSLSPLRSPVGVPPPLPPDSLPPFITLSYTCSITLRIWYAFNLNIFDKTYFCFFI